MNVIFNVEKCLIPKLAKNVDDTEKHSEYKVREAELRKHFEIVINDLKCANLRENLEISAKILSAVLILYKDLLSKGPWATELLVQYANKLSAQCECLYEVKAADLIKNCHILGEAGPQLIFDESMASLHHKLTSNNFKKYPSLIEVYCSIIQDIHTCSNVTVSVKAMPISLYLIEDYNLEYKKKGLKSAENILKCLKPTAFEDGNYYHVIFLSLKNAFTVRDIEITRFVIECLKELFRLLPTDSDFKKSASDELFPVVLEYIDLESSLYRKAALFRFMKHLIEINGVNCVNKKMFQTVVCYNLNVCCIKGTDDIMLLPIVICFEEWVKHCWCHWRPSSSENIYLILLKLLYLSNDDIAEKIMKIIATLISLCDSKRKEKLLTSIKIIHERNERLRDRIGALVNILI